MLVDEGAGDVRGGLVALSPRTATEVLTKLAYDTDPAVHWAVADNMRTPVETLDRLGDDASPLVRLHAARNPRLPAEWLAELARDDRSAIREAVTGHPPPWSGR